MKMADAIKYRETSSIAQFFQNMLISKGYKLPRWGADGVPGMETFDAAKAYARAHDLCSRWAYSDDDYKVIPPEVVTHVITPIGTDSPEEIMDIRYDHPITKGSQTPRYISDVTGIMLHQTACHPGLGNRPSRWHDISCHMGISPTGQIFYVNDFSTHIWHGHGYNRTTIGIEVDGNFAGIASNLGTLWKKGGGPSVHSPEQAVSVRKAIRFICDDMKRRGVEIKFIVAHRQGSDQRQSDPGDLIWLNCGVWAQMELGLYNNPMEKKGSGYRIEYDYDPRGMVNWQNRWDKRGLRRASAIMAKCMGFTNFVPITAYGSKWKRLVGDFQGFAGIGVDGDFGSKTHQAMEAKVGYRWTPEEIVELKGKML
jgi:hypothetical protein